MPRGIESALIALSVVLFSAVALSYVAQHILPNLQAILALGQLHP